MENNSEDPIKKLKVLISLMAIFIIVALYQIYSLATDNWNCNAALKVYQEHYAKTEDKTAFSGETSTQVSTVVTREKKQQTAEDTTH